MFGLNLSVLNLLGPGNGRVTYPSRFTEPIPKNSL